MTDEFQRGLITGLAMQPLQVTTEHATPDEPTMVPSEFIHGIIGDIGTISIFQAIIDDLEL